MKRLVGILIFIIVGQMSCFGALAAQIEAPGPSILTINLSSTSENAAITDSVKGEAQFLGNVTVQMVKGQRISVSLTSTVDLAGWAASVNPDNMMFTSNEPQPFIVKVSVQEGQPAWTVGTVSISGEAKGSGLTATDEATATVTVLPYYRINMECKNNRQQIAPGGLAEFNFKVWNMGNAADSFDLELVDRKGLESRGWDVSITPALLTDFPMGEYREVKVAARAPISWDWSPYKFENTVIELRGASKGAGEAGRPSVQSYPMRIDQKGLSLPGVAVVIILAVVVLASVVAIVMRIRRKRRARRKASLKEDGGEEK